MKKEEEQEEEEEKEEEEEEVKRLMERNRMLVPAEYVVRSSLQLLAADDCTGTHKDSLKFNDFVIDKSTPMYGVILANAYNLRYTCSGCVHIILVYIPNNYAYINICICTR